MADRSIDCLLAHASELAYDIRDRDSVVPSPTPVLPTDSPYFDQVVAGDLAVFVGGRELIDAAFVARMPSGDVVVSIRGTLPPGRGHLWSWVDDWLQDLDVDPRPWSVGDDLDVPYGRVEHGFDDAVLELWARAPRSLPGPGDGGDAAPGIRPWLHHLFGEGAAAEPSATPPTIYVTGHSKGAAATYLVASLIRADSVLKDVPVEVVCFASPYVCDAAFRRCYDEAGLLETTLRYQNVDDAVPFGPNFLIAAPLALAKRLHPKASGGAGPWWTWAYVSMGDLRVITRDVRIVEGAAGWWLAFVRIVVDLLTFQIGRIASAHSLVFDPTSTHPTGRYTCGACTPGDPCPPTAQAAPRPAAAAATAAP